MGGGWCERPGPPTSAAILWDPSFPTHTTRPLGVPGITRSVNTPLGFSVSPPETDCVHEASAVRRRDKEEYVWREWMGSLRPSGSRTPGTGPTKSLSHSSSLTPSRRPASVPHFWLPLLRDHLALTLLAFLVLSTRRLEQPSLCGFHSL